MGEKVVKEWEFVKYEQGDFKCALCGGRGKNQVILRHKNGKEVAVGFTCLHYFGVDQSTLPPHPRKIGSSEGGNRWQRVKDVAGDDEWEIIEEKVEPFQCLCGGKGKRQVVLKNTVTDETVAVGQSCMKKYFKVKNQILPVKAKVRLSKSDRKAQPDEIAKALGL